MFTLQILIYLNSLKTYYSAIMELLNINLLGDILMELIQLLLYFPHYIFIGFCSLS